MMDAHSITQILGGSFSNGQLSSGAYRSFLTAEGEKLERDTKVILGLCAGGVVRPSQGADSSNSFLRTAS